MTKRKEELFIKGSGEIRGRLEDIKYPLPDSEKVLKSLEQAILEAMRRERKNV